MLKLQQNMFVILSFCIQGSAGAAGMIAGKLLAGVDEEEPKAGNAAGEGPLSVCTVLTVINISRTPVKHNSKDWKKSH